MLHFLFKGTFLRIEGEKSPAPGGNWTHDFSVTRCVLHRWATNATLFKIDLSKERNFESKKVANVWNKFSSKNSFQKNLVGDAKEMLEATL